jgi:hypothetical protein
MGFVADDAFSKLQLQVSLFAEKQLRLLLETKHLYQKVSIQPDEILARLTPPDTSSTVSGLVPVVDEKNEFKRLAANFLRKSLIITERVLFEGIPPHPQRCLVVGNVKLFCKKCEGREAFRPIGFSDVTQSLRVKYEEQVVSGIPNLEISFPVTFQLFVLIFQCQVCQGIPETFLVKRDGMDLFLEGRSPIEHVELPKFIPKEEQKWFRDALIAFQSGKILAAIFYLRTFVEQFARRVTNTQNDKKTGEIILSAYARTIPENIRGTMPSLAEWYEKLSEALHGAKEDSELFEAAREKIDNHFDIRRVHKLDSKVAADTKKKENKTPAGSSGEGEHRFRREAERHSGAKVNSSRSEATLTW